MPSREQALVDTYKGLNQSGVPLISYSKESGYIPEGFTDDIGAYWLIPKLSQLFNLDVVTMAKITYATTVILAYIILVIGFMYLIKQKKNRMFAIILSSIVAILFFIKFDLYVFNFLALSLIPLIILSFKNYLKSKNVLVFMLSILLISLVAWILNNFRNNSGSTIIIFIIFAISFWIQKKILLKAVVIAFILMISFMPNSVKDSIVHKRDNFIKVTAPDKYVDRSNHVIWHSIYIGLGFISNKYVSSYNDKEAIDKVNEIIPNAVYCSKEYENVLKNEFFNIFKNSPFLVISITICKALIIMIINLAVLNIQLFKLNKNNILISLPFIVAIAFAMIPGVLTVPRLNYILMSIGLTVVFKIFIKNDFFNIASYRASN